jgi:hypothetical protein
MSVYYFNGAQILAPLTITSNEPLYEVDTVSLKKQRANQGIQRWELSFNTIGTSETQVDIFLGSAADNYTVQTMIMPQLPEVAAKTTVSSSSFALPGLVSAGVTSMTITSGNNIGLLPKGSFFKFSNHDKIYVTTSDTTISGVTSTVDFYPKLRMDVGSLHAFQCKELALLSFYRDIGNQTGITFTDGVLSNAGTISVIEAL